MTYIYIIVYIHIYILKNKHYKSSMANHLGEFWNLQNLKPFKMNDLFDCVLGYRFGSSNKILLSCTCHMNSTLHPNTPGTYK